MSKKLNVKVQKHNNKPYCFITYDRKSTKFPAFENLLSYSESEEYYRKLITYLIQFLGDKFELKGIKKKLEVLYVPFSLYLDDFEVDFGNYLTYNTYTYLSSIAGTEDSNDFDALKVFLNPSLRLKSKVNEFNIPDDIISMLSEEDIDALYFFCLVSVHHELYTPELIDWLEHPKKRIKELKKIVENGDFEITTNFKFPRHYKANWKMIETFVNQVIYRVNWYISSS